MKIRLSDHFNISRLLRFTLPSIGMMIFTSIYGVVDGFFVSNFAGEDAFSAVGFIWPFIMVISTVGFMFGAGGNALVSKTLGEGDEKRANSYFSMLVYLSFAVGCMFTVLGIIFIRPIAAFLGASGQMLDYCVVYGRIILYTLPFYMLQVEFQSFFITAERPKLGLWVTVASGVANIVLDALLVGVLPFGIVGAAIATASSQLVGGVIPIFYFISKRNKSLLRLGRARLDGRAILKTCTNGSSELMSNLSMSLVAMLYNAQLLRYAGQNGVAAYAAIMYVNMIFLSIFIGYSVGVAPVVGYHFGAENHAELKSLLKKSVAIIAVSSVLMLGLAFLLAKPLSQIYVGYNPVLYDMTVKGFYVFSFSFLFAGFAIFASGFFTALNDGLTSAVISFLRTVVFQVCAVIVLPMFLGLDGIWLSVVFAEVMADVVSLVFIMLKRKKFKYM